MQLGGLCRPPGYAERIWRGSPTYAQLRAVERTFVPDPFGIVCHLQRLKEGEQAVVGPEAGSLATLVRLELRQGCFLECEVGV